MKKFVVYLAGSMTGLSYEESFENFNSRKYSLENYGFDVIHPFIGKDYLKEEGELKSSGYTEFPLSKDSAIVSRDRWMVGQADILLVDLSLAGNKVSIGSMFEIAWASELHKNIVVVMQEDNIHQHAFVKQSATVIYNTVDEAIKYLAKLIGKDVQ